MALMQVEYKSKLEGIEGIATELLRDKLNERSRHGTGQGSGHRKTE